MDNAACTAGERSDCHVVVLALLLTPRNDGVGDGVRRTSVGVRSVSGWTPCVV